MSKTAPPEPDAPTTDEPTPRWGRRLFGWSKELVITVLLMVAIVPLMGWLRAPDLPAQAPAFVLPDLDGETVALQELRGQTVVLNFWATWCGPCRMEIPFFSGFADAHPDIAVLGIAVDGSPGKLRASARKLGITYPVLVAQGTTVQAAYDVSTLPTTVVVGPEGEVWSAHTGIMTTPQLWWATRDWF